MFKQLVLCFVLMVVAQLSYGQQDAIKVTLLGTGSPIISLKRHGPATLIEAGGEVLLFDAGRGVAQRLHQAGMPLGKIDKLFVTHLHSDHITGIPDILLSGWMFGRKVPLRVYGPKGTETMFKHLHKAFSYDRKIRVEDVGYDEKAAFADVSDIKEGVIYEANGLTVTAIEVDHYPIKPAFGFRIDYKGRSVVLSGDTRYSENLIKFSKGVDLLIHEVAMAPQKAIEKSKTEGGMLAHHTLPQDAGNLFSKAQPKLAVYTHVILTGGVTEADLFNETRKTYQGPLRIGQDLMTFEVGDFITIERR